MSYLCQKYKQQTNKNLGVTDFVSELNRVENYPDFEKLENVIQHGLQGFIAKNTEDEANDLSDIL